MHNKLKRSHFMKKKILIILLIVFIITVFAMIPIQIISKMTNYHSTFEIYDSAMFGVKSNEIELMTEDGLKLAAWEVETSEPKGAVIFISGIHNPSVTYFFPHAQMMENNGYSSLLVELRAHGKSEGEKISLGMQEYLDVKAGVEYLKSNEKYKDLPIIVFGVSMGGATAINSIGQIDEIDGVISLSAYSNWADVFCDNMVELGVPRFVAEIEKLFVWLYLGFDYGFDKIAINPLNEIKKLDGRPALLMHSKGDSQVPFESYERLIATAEDDVSTYVREGNYHFITYDGYSNKPWADTEYSETILDFLEENFG
jgi:fermentation-respiration switch protein FrsA (DUF1100 family)